MPVPIAVAAAVAKGGAALKAAGATLKGAQAVKSATAVAKTVQTAAPSVQALKGSSLLSSGSLATKGGSTASMISKMSDIADNVTHKVGCAHSAMENIVSRDNMSNSPDMGQAFDSVKPGRVEEPLNIGNTPDQNNKSSFMKGFEQGLGISNEPSEHTPNSPQM